MAASFQKYTNMSKKKKKKDKDMYQQFINVSGKEWHSLFYTKAGAWLWLEVEALKSAQGLFFQCDDRKCQRPRGRAVLGEGGGGSGLLSPSLQQKEMSPIKKHTRKTVKHHSNTVMAIPGI